MTIAYLLHRIATDTMLQAMLAAITLDLLLGVLAALKLGTFRLAYLTNFLRNDLLGKVAPWIVLDLFAIVAGGANIVIPGVDLTNIAHAAGAGILAAMVGSILGSLKDLGFPVIPASLSTESSSSAPKGV